MVWPVVNLIGWMFTGVAVSAMVWVAPGPGRYLFLADAPRQSVVAAMGAAILVGFPGLMLFVLASLSLLSRVSGARWAFAARFERSLGPGSPSQYPAYLATHVGFIAFAVYWLVAR